MSELVEEQRGWCRHCGHAIVWYFDRDDDAEPLEHGIWFDAEYLTEACGGPTGDPDDLGGDDIWHEPEPT